MGMNRVDNEIKPGRTTEHERTSWSGWRRGHRMGKSVTATFGWLGLVAVLAAACGLESAVASIGLDRTQEAASSLSVSDTQRSVGHHDTVPIMITLRDRASGTDMQWRCMSSSDRAPAEELVVDANALADVAIALCGPTQ